ncbi:hypothetical protein SLA2020_247600 [Shorea laevis]
MMALSSTIITTTTRPSPLLLMPCLASVQDFFGPEKAPSSPPTPQLPVKVATFPCLDYLQSGKCNRWTHAVRPQLPSYKSGKR